MSSDSISGLFDLTFKSIIDSLPCYIMIQDRDLKILFANHKLQHDFGDDIVNQSCYSVLKGSGNRCRVCPVSKTFEDKKVHIIEEVIHLSDGHTTEMIAYSAPLFDVLGNVNACIKLLVDVGRIKDSQRELVTLGQSIALLSHDIKNILEGLQGGAYVVDEGIKDNDMALSNKGWNIVKKNINEITGITQNILYSAKDRKPLMRLSSPADVAGHACRLFSEKAATMGIQLIPQLNAKLPRLMQDTTGISRMLGNLIWNALQACQADTDKTKHMVYVRLDYYNTSHLMYEVEDNAGGMSRATRDFLFQEFFSSKGDAGTGLGLMVVERIVRSHKGKIEVLTKPGKGSLFRIIFRLDNQKLELKEPELNKNS